MKLWWVYNDYGELVVTVRDNDELDVNGNVITWTDMEVFVITTEGYLLRIDNESDSNPVIIMDGAAYITGDERIILVIGTDNVLYVARVPFADMAVEMTVLLENVAYATTSADGVSRFVHAITADGALWRMSQPEWGLTFEFYEPEFIMDGVMVPDFWD